MFVGIRVAAPARLRQARADRPRIKNIASTLLNELGFSPDVIELQLAHSPRDKVRSAYSRAERLDARRALFRELAAHVRERLDDLDLDVREATYVGTLAGRVRGARHN